MIKAQSDASPLEVMNEIGEMEEVEEVLLVSGDWPIIARIKFNKMEEVTSFIINKLPKIGKIVDSNALIILDKNRQMLQRLLK